MRIVLGAGLIVVAALAAVLLLEPFVLNAANGLERDGKIDEEIAMLRDAEIYVPWSGKISGRLDDALVRRTEVELQADRLDRAAHAWREAWARARARGFSTDDRVMAAGVTVYARGAQRFHDHGELALAADWNDSLFVLAVRAPVDAHRQAALSAFQEGLAFRAEAGDACGAVARVRWARKTLGGVIPGFDRQVEADLTKECSRQKAQGANE